MRYGARHRTSGRLSVAALQRREGPHCIGCLRNFFGPRVLAKPVAPQSAPRLTSIVLPSIGPGDSDVQKRHESGSLIA